MKNKPKILGSEDIYDHESLLKIIGSNREYMIDVETEEVWNVRLIKI